MHLITSINRPFLGTLEQTYKSRPNPLIIHRLLIETHAINKNLKFSTHIHIHIRSRIPANKAERV